MLETVQNLRLCDFTQNCFNYDKSTLEEGQEVGLVEALHFPKSQIFKL